MASRSTITIIPSANIFFLFNVNIRTYFAVSKFPTTVFAVSLMIEGDLTTIGVGLTTTGSTF